ncbi:hypothetical protein GCM10023317_85270 [Actinopolymorpha pittospori]
MEGGGGARRSPPRTPSTWSRTCRRPPALDLFRWIIPAVPLAISLATIPLARPLKRSTRDAQEAPVAFHQAEAHLRRRVCGSCGGFVVSFLLSDEDPSDDQI